MTPEGNASQASHPGAARVGLRQLVVLVILGLSLALIVIDSTIVNIAIPSIQKTFAVSVKGLEWISAIYAIFFGSFILTWGKFGDEFGRRRIFMSGVVTFIIGSTLTGISNDLTTMLVGRAVQGFGAAMASPSTLSIITTTFTGRARGVAFGIWGAIAGAAGALGPLLGGYFTTYLSWRWAFLINVPIGLFALVGAMVFVKESRFKDRDYSTDFEGVVLITLSLSALIFGLIEGQTYGWLTPSEAFVVGSFIWPLTTVSITVVSILAGISLFFVFVLAERRRVRRGKVPLVDFSMFQYRGFRYGILTVAIVAMGEFGIFFILSLYLQIVRGLSAIDTGITLLPMALVVLISAPLAGLLSSKVGPKWIVTTGMVLEGIALFSMSQIITVTMPIYYLYPSLVIYGAGVGLAIGQVTNTILTSIPWQKAGIGSGINNTVRQIGAAFGVAAIGAVLVAEISAIGQADLAASSAIPAAIKVVVANVLNTGLAGGVGGPPPGTAGTPLAAAITAVFDDAITQGTRWASLTAGVFVSLGAICSLLIPNAKPKEAPPPQPRAQHGDRQSEV